MATKADHVPEMRRENLKNLLRSVVEAAKADQPDPAGHPVSYHAAAAVLATEDGKSQRDGRAVEVVRGVLLGETAARSFHAGDVPSSRPPESFWGASYFELPVFMPPRLDPSGQLGIPQLGLDDGLAKLLGDVL